MTEYSDVIHIRLRPDQKQLVEERANEADESVSSWTRRVLLNEADEERESFRARKTERMGYRLAAEIEEADSVAAWMRSVLNARARKVIENMEDHLPVPSRDETEEETEQEVEEHEHVEA